MNKWLRFLTVLTPTLGGAFGVLLASLAVYRLRGQTLGEIEAVAFLVLYVFVTGSSLLYVYDSRRIRPILIAIGIQIPLISLPVFEYQFVAGVNLAILFGSASGTERAGLTVKWTHQIVTDCSFRLGQLQAGPPHIGVNLFAVVLIVFLWLSSRRLGNDS